jgi:hypothetical protein
MGAGVFSFALSGWLFMALGMVLLYFVQRARKDAEIVDVSWTAKKIHKLLHLITRFSPKRWA